MKTPFLGRFLISKIFPSIPNFSQKIKKLRMASLVFAIPFFMVNPAFAAIKPGGSLDLVGSTTSPVSSVFWYIQSILKKCYGVTHSYSLGLTVILFALLTKAIEFPIELSKQKSEFQWRQ